jgi:hypothetical protein
MNLRSRHFAVALAVLAVWALGSPVSAQDTFDGNIIFGNGSVLRDDVGGGCGTNLINFLYNDTGVDPLLGDPRFPGHDWVPANSSIASGDNDNLSTIAYVNADTCDTCNAARVFEQECYRGALPPPSMGADWTAGWTCHDELGTCRPALGNLVFLSGAQPTSFWSSNNTYVLQGKVWFPAGTSLTIQAGTVVLGENATAGYLTIDPGAQIFSLGTAANPVIMTTDLDPPIVGGWGGLVIHGNAVANCADCLGGQLCSSEGGAGDFCGTNDCDNSGSVRYTRVQYAGVEISLDNELNAFTFNGVGSETVLEYLQAHMGADDCFEWFGGKANVNHIVATGPGDDGVDWQMGFRGTVQYAVVQFYDNQGDKGIEADNNEYDFDAPCRSNPLVANCTFIGPPADAANPTATYGNHFRRGTDFQVFNSIIAYFPNAGLRVSDAPTCARGTNPQPDPAPCATDAPIVAGGFNGDLEVRAFPNPMVNQTQFSIAMEQAGPARLDVFDVRGRLVDNVLDEQLSAGTHRVTWTPDERLGGGTYFFRMERNDGVKTGKLVVVR